MELNSDTIYLDTASVSVGYGHSRALRHGCMFTLLLIFWPMNYTFGSHILISGFDNDAEQGPVGQLGMKTFCPPFLIGNQSLHNFPEFEREDLNKGGIARNHLRPERLIKTRRPDHLRTL